MSHIMQMMLLNPELGDLLVYQSVSDSPLYGDWQDGTKFTDNEQYQTKFAFLSDNTMLYIRDIVSLITGIHFEILAFGKKQPGGTMMMKVQAMDVGPDPDSMWYPITFFQNLVQGYDHRL
jgi:hypothetical protein